MGLDPRKTCKRKRRSGSEAAFTQSLKHAIVEWFDAEIKVDGPIFYLQRDHRVKTCQQQAIWDLHFAGRGRHRDVAVAKDIFRILDGQDEASQLVQFANECLVELIDPMAIAASYLVTAALEAEQVEADIFQAVGFDAIEVDCGGHCRRV
jgi:hypothetical protein